MNATPQTASDPPFRTDAGNANLPWYRLKPGEFPPHDSAHIVVGELVEVDYIHRSGVLRERNTRDLMAFSLLPYGSVSYLGAEADLRDVPLGTSLYFYLYQDAQGSFTQAAAILDDFTGMAFHEPRYRMEEVDTKTGKMLATIHTPHSKQEEPDAGPQEFLVDSSTHVWKDRKPATLSDLKEGDWLLCNFTFDTVLSPIAPLRCTDIWAGESTQQMATEQQRKRHFAFLKARGVPAWIDRTEGDHMTVTLFSSDPAALEALFKAEGIDPARWAKEHRRISVAVANEHLRTYNPPVDNKWATVLEFESLPAGRYGRSGVRWVLQPDVMLEGFRKGRIVRLFAHPSWPIEPMPFGEGLHAGGHDEEPADSKELQAADFPYRTDFGNEHLPWYRLQPDKFPPDHSEHRVRGTLTKVNPDGRSGRFRNDRTGVTVDFTLPPVGKVLCLNAESSLADLPLDTQCLFFLYQDEKGAFTRAAVVMDEYSYLASNTLTYRLEALHLDVRKLFVVRHAAPVKVDYVLEPRVPSDFGRIELDVNENTRVWKGDKQIKLTDLMVGDELLVNLRPPTPTSRGRCTDIWVGAETHKRATEQQRRKHEADLKAQASPAPNTP